MARRIIGIHEKLPILENLPLSFQHLTAMFGATILVPILLGVDPAIALLMNGIGTLIYSWVTKGGIPAYLGSSFAFIAPAMLVISSYGGFSHAQSGFIFFGLFFIVISFVVKYWGIRWIDVVMPPAVMGAVVAIINCNHCSSLYCGISRAYQSFNCNWKNYRNRSDGKPGIAPLTPG